MLLSSFTRRAGTSSIQAGLRSRAGGRHAICMLVTPAPSATAGTAFVMRDVIRIACVSIKEAACYRPREGLCRHGGGGKPEHPSAETRIFLLPKKKGKRVLATYTILPATSITMFENVMLLDAGNLLQLKFGSPGGACSTTMNAVVSGTVCSFSS